MSLIFLIKLCYANFEIVENTESPAIYTIHLGEPNIIHKIPEADDATLVSF